MGVADPILFPVDSGHCMWAWLILYCSPVDSGTMHVGVADPILFPCRLRTLCMWAWLILHILFPCRLRTLCMWAWLSYSPPSTHNWTCTRWRNCSRTLWRTRELAQRSQVRAGIVVPLPEIRTPSIPHSSKFSRVLLRFPDNYLHCTQAMEATLIK